MHVLRCCDRARLCVWMTLPCDMGVWLCVLLSIIASRINQKNFQLIIITHDEDFVRTLSNQMDKLACNTGSPYYYLLSRRETYAAGTNICVLLLFVCGVTWWGRGSVFPARPDRPCIIDCCHLRSPGVFHSEIHQQDWD